MTNDPNGATDEGMCKPKLIDLDGALACAASLVGLAYDVALTHMQAIEGEDGTKEWRIHYTKGTQHFYLLPMIRDAAEKALAEVDR